MVGTSASNSPVANRLNIPLPPVDRLSRPAIFATGISTPAGALGAGRNRSRPRLICRPSSTQSRRPRGALGVADSRTCPMGRARALRLGAARPPARRSAPSATGSPSLSASRSALQPDVFEAPVVVDAVDVQRHVLDVRPPAAGGAAVGDDRFGHLLLQLAVDLPDHLQSLLLVELARLRLEQLGHLRIAVAVVVA